MVEESGSNPNLEKEQHSTSPFRIWIKLHLQDCNNQHRGKYQPFRYYFL